MRLSILVSTFKRPNLLKWGLHSISLQKFQGEFEVIVLNDGLLDETEEICQSFSNCLDIKYLFTGHRNLKPETTAWRIPGFAINIGAKMAQGDAIIISCAEMYYIHNDSLEKLVQPIEEDKTRLGICHGKDDNSSILAYLNQHSKFPTHLLGKCKPLNCKLPFAMALNKARFIEIGGYDEDFTGVAFDDNDLVDRFIDSGSTYFTADTTVVHLYHPRHVSRPTPPWYFNQKLYQQRRGKIIRNEGREWGIQP